MAGNIDKRERNLTEALENSDHKRLEDLFCFNDNQEEAELKTALEHMKWILPRVCELGFLDILQRIFDLHVIDINASYLGKTGLQYACEKGHTDVVTWLLDNGAKFKENVWEKDSEFYLSTLNGKQDALTILIERNPELVSDPDVRYCLFYAACEGGHLELVKKWFSPGTDVTKTEVFTSDLDGCEQNYPLFAACKGEHLEVARFLINEGNAVITKDICHCFQKFTTRLVWSIFLSYDKNGRLSFNMSSQRIERLLPCWFSWDKENVNIPKETGDDFNEDKDKDLEIVINVQETNLQDLPDEVLWNLKELVSLNASHNPLGEISDPLHPGSLQINGLKSLKLADCNLTFVSPHLFFLPCLEELNLSNNKLSTMSLKETGPSCTSWKYSKLQNLDISHNLFESLPHDIQVCTEVTLLNASHNQLVTAFTPWQCPLKYLDLSNNKFTTFAPNSDQYWGKTLKKLQLQHNQIIDLPESIVNMGVLSYLDVSHNRIQRMPASSLWRCPLTFLNLNHNNLGIAESNGSLEFPASYLRLTLMELFIANNQLMNLPESICDLKQLYVLDLSHNTKIRNLPPELGNLKHLYKLKVDGIVMQDADLQKLLSTKNITNDVHANSVIGYLERKLWKCVCPNILKIIVLGCKNKDGDCIVQGLANNRNVSSSEHESMTVTEMMSPQRKCKYEIWELPDNNITAAILPCFLTLNSLYLIVHDASNYGDDLHSLSEKIASIQACVLCPYMIIICKYSRVMNREEQVKLERKIINAFPTAKFVSITSGIKECFSLLHQQIYAAYETMKDVVYDRKVSLCQRQVPGKFLEVVGKIKRLNKNNCKMEELLHVAECSKKDLDERMYQHMKLHEFLLQVGAMLHYNSQMGELSDLVILNPAWLFEILSKFLKSLTKKNQTKIAQLPLSAVRDRFREILSNYDHFPALLKLMEVFNIGVRLTDSIKDKDEVNLLVPSLLPKQPPQFQLYVEENSFKAARLYCLPVVPSALWSHLISQLILAFGRLSTSNWKLGECISRTSTTSENKSFMMSCRKSSQGLCINNKKIQYWRTGIMIYYDQGHVVVEEVECITSTGVSESGILVTVQTTGTKNLHNKTEQLDNMRKLSVMGVVIDEIEEVLELFNPKFRDQNVANINQVYALCPLCFNITPGSGSINLKDIHFKVVDCAQMLLSKDVVVCQKGPSSLFCLVPELLFMELPSEMHLSSEEIVLTDVNLGHGMAGAVTKANYKDIDVAVKLFYDSTIRLSLRSINDVQYPNIADSKQDFENQQLDFGTEQRKISIAFSDVRREIGILSKLKHEFIVTFIGVCVRPQLLLVIELAPYGSLRAVLESRTKDMFNNVEQRDTEITQMIFSKDLTYKIILQIGCGLCYLHENNIIYRDLKPDNILMMSLSVDDRVNVKLSDYGISKFTTLQGVTGQLGTLGYMAPEVLSKQLYNEKADIYSCGIVMLDTLTGCSPLENMQRHQRSHEKNTDITPAHVQGCTIKCNFPCLESLMKDCWSHEMDERPSSINVVKRMKSDQFLLLHDSIILNRDSPEKLEITCIYACKTGGRWKIWICESGKSSRRFISVYDVASSGFMVYRKVCPGPQISDMAKVGSRIWVVCKDLNNLTVIERGNHSNFEISNGPTLEAKATKIFSHCYENSEESKHIILVGLENGCLTIFHFSNSYKKSVTAIINLELQKYNPITDICSIDHTLIAVACGMTVYLKQVGLPDCQGDEAKSAWIPELTNFGNVSLQNVTDVYSPVTTMAAEGKAVWCCLENSPFLAKVDVGLKQIVQVLTISWNCIHDTLRIEEVDIVYWSRMKLVASKSCAASANSTSDYENMDKEQSSLPNDSDMRSEIVKEREVYYVINSGLISVPETTLLSRDRSKTAHEGPPLPPRHVLMKATSMPELDIQPPLVPTRSCQEEHVSITSLKLATDVLIIGISSGAMVLLPLNYGNSDTSACPPTLPCQLPVLRHPSKNTNVLTSQGFTSTGSISNLILANDKVVSLHNSHNRVRLRLESTRRGMDGKRKGRLYTLESLSHSRQEASKETSCTNIDMPQSTLRLNSTSAKADKIQQPVVADIAVWDKITQSRLHTIRSFGHNLINCGGWCCRAPNNVPVSASANNVL